MGLHIQEVAMCKTEIENCKNTVKFKKKQYINDDFYFEIQDTWKKKKIKKIFFNLSWLKNYFLNNFDEKECVLPTHSHFFLFTVNPPLNRVNPS